MPIFDFKCLDCGLVVEKIIRTSNYEDHICEKCGKAMEKQVSKVSFELKGTGWTPKGKGYLGV